MTIEEHFKNMTLESGESLLITNKIVNFDETYRKVDFVLSKGYELLSEQEKNEILRRLIVDLTICIKTIFIHLEREKVL